MLRPLATLLLFAAALATFDPSSRAAEPPARGDGVRLSGEAGLFGIAATGSKFVYVFDRSGSMSEFEGRPLAAAKRELLASLKDLDSVQQFQVIFYNQKADLIAPTGRARMLYGTEDDKGLAADFISRIKADGGSLHRDALKTALRYSPDTIFFLSDAGEPELTADELQELRKANERVGAAIHVVEFGSTEEAAADSVMRKLAAQNGGKYVYVNVKKLPARE